MTQPESMRVHIIGTGLIGTSIGLALRRVGWLVTLDDRDVETLSRAVERGAGLLRVPEDEPPDIVVVSTPPDQTAGVLVEASQMWPTATLTDVASVKAHPLREAAMLGVDEHRLVGGHPMAGREVSGPEGARSDLFDDRVWVVCPTPGTDADRVGEVERMARACGSITTQMAPDRHDAAVALTSHAPQVLSSVLAARLIAADEDAVSVAGQGFRDMTRIADSDPALWQAILTLNASPIAGVLRDVVEDLSHIVVALESATQDDDRVVIVDALRRGAEGRSRIPGKHGAEHREYEVVSVMVRDEPGELARLFVAAGALGLNLEDVRIEHVLGKPSGLIDLSVKPEVAGALHEGLTEQGFDVRS
jgi:prephenate dehydrogenase